MASLNEPLIQPEITQPAEIELKPLVRAKTKEAKPDSAAAINDLAAKVLSAKTSVIKYKQVFDKFKILANSANLVVAVMSNGFIGTFDINSQKFVGATLELKVGVVTSLAVSGDDKLAAVSGTERTIMLCEISDNGISLKAELKGHSRAVEMVQFIGDNTLYSCSLDKSVRVWDLTASTSEVVFRLEQKPKVLATNGVNLIVGDNIGQIHSFNLTSQQEPLVLVAHSSQITAIKLSDTNKFVATGSLNGELCVWDIETLENLWTTNEEKEVKSISFGPKDHYLAASFVRNKKLKVWNMIKKEEPIEFEGHKDDILCVKFRETANHISIYTSSKDKTLRVWSYFGRSEEGLIEAYETDERYKYILYFNRTYIAIALQNRVDIWNLKTLDAKGKNTGRKRVTQLEGFDNMKIVSMDYSSIDNLFVVATEFDGIFLYNSNTWTRLKRKKDSNTHSGVTCVKFHPVYGHIVTGGSDGKISFRDVHQLKVFKELQENADPITCIDFAVNKNLLISGSEDQTVSVWNLNDNNKVVSFEDDMFELKGLKVTPDESKIICWDVRSSIYIWNINDKLLESVINISDLSVYEKHLQELLGESSENSRIVDIYITADQRYMLIPYTDGKLRIWSIETRTPVTFLNCGIVYNFVIDSKEKYIYYCSPDGLKVTKSPLYEKYFNVHNPLKSPTETIHYLYQLLQDQRPGDYSPEMDYIFIAPYHITMANIYAYYGYLEHLKAHLTHHFSIIRDVNGFTPINTCLDIKELDSVDLMIKALVNSIPIQKYVACLIDGSIIALNEAGTPSLNRLYEALWITSTSTSLPKFAIENLKLPYHHFSDMMGIQKQNFLAEADITDKGQAIVFKESLIKQNYAMGSEESLSFLYSLEECGNEEIFRTPFIQQLMLYKWGKARIYAITQLAIYVLYITLLTIIDCTSFSELVLQILLLITNILLFSFEVFQMITDFKEYWLDAWNNIDFARNVLCFGFIIVDMADLGYRKELLALLTLISWVRGMSYFRIFESTRYLINLVFEVFKDMIAFLALLIYCTLSYCFIRMIFTSGQENGGFENSLKAAYVMNFGDIGEDNPSSVTEWVVITLMMLINPIVMLNLLISILGDTYSRVQENSVIADMKELLEMIIEVEQLLYWRKNIGSQRYFQMLLSKESEEEIEDPLDAKLKALGRKVDFIKTETKNYVSRLDKFETSTAERLEKLEDIINNSSEEQQAKIDGIITKVGEFDVLGTIIKEMSKKLNPDLDIDGIFRAKTVEAEEIPEPVAAVAAMPSAPVPAARMARKKAVKKQHGVARIRKA